MNDVAYRLERAAICRHSWRDVLRANLVRKESIFTAAAAAALKATVSLWQVHDELGLCM